MVFSSWCVDANEDGRFLLGEGIRQRRLYINAIKLQVIDK